MTSSPLSCSDFWCRRWEGNQGSSCGSRQLVSWIWAGVGLALAEDVCKDSNRALSFLGRSALGSGVGHLAS